MTLLRCCSQGTQVLALCLWKSPFLICIQSSNHSPPSLLWHPSQGCQLWVREIYSSSQHHHQQQEVIGRERSKEEKHPEPSSQRTRSAPRPNRLHPMSLQLLDNPPAPGQEWLTKEQGRKYKWKPCERVNAHRDTSHPVPIPHLQKDVLVQFGLGDRLSCSQG